MSGPYRHYGEGLLAGARLAAENLRVHGRKIELIVEGEPSSHEEARKLVARFLGEGVVAVVGPMTASGCHHMLPLMDEPQVLAVIPSVRDPWLTRQGWRHVFRLDFDGGSQASVQALYAERLGETAVVLHSTSVYWSSVAELFADSYRGHVRINQSFDTTPYACALAARVTVQYRPDVIYIAGDQPELIGILRELARYSPLSRIVLCAGLDSGDFNMTPIAGLREVYGTDWRAPDHSYPSFARRYYSASRQEPPYFSPEGFDAVGIIVEAMDKVLATPQGTAIDTHALSRHIANKHYSGVTGIISFNDVGDRRDQGPIRIDALTLTGGKIPTRILCLEANPNGTDSLRLDREAREISQSLERAGTSAFVLEVRQATRTRDLRQAMLGVDPHIVHFAGHGAGAPGLILDDDDGVPRAVAGGALADLFGMFKSVRCVLLNACFSATQAGAIAEHVPYVIGLTHSVSDEAAIQFAAGFYDALAADKPIPFAFELARNAVELHGLRSDAEPILLARDSSQSRCRSVNAVVTDLADGSTASRE